MLPDGWARAQGANRGMAEVEDEEGDILPARAVPDGRTMEFRVGPSTAAAPRGGRAGGERMNPLKSGILRATGARRGAEGRESASGIRIVCKWSPVRFVPLSVVRFQFT